MSLTTRRFDKSNDWVTIEPCPRLNAMWSVYEHSTYERGSVLEGQPKRSLVECYETLDEATAHYPGAEVLDYSTRNVNRASVPAMPPPWFDPAACGERWDDD